LEDIHCSRSFDLCGVGRSVGHTVQYSVDGGIDILAKIDCSLSRHVGLSSLVALKHHITYIRM
jgi:hypothetical protein